MAIAQQEIEQARALAQQGNSEAAVALLSQLIQRDTSNAAAWLELSDVVDDPERAEYCLQKVLNLDPGNAAALEKLSETKGGSLSVGLVGGLNHSDSPSGDDPVPAQAPQAAESDETDRPELSEASSEELDQQDELPAPENLANVSVMDAAEPEEPQESVVQREAADPVPEILAETSNADALEPEGSQDSEAQLESAAAGPGAPAQAPAGRSSVSHTDLILIGLTVLAGIVLCALVSAALIT